MSNRRPQILAIVTLALCGVLGARVNPAVTEPSQSRLEKLLEDRVAVHRESVEQYVRHGSKWEALIGTRDLLRAELDTLTGKSDRIRKLEQIVEHEKKMAEFLSRPNSDLRFPERQRMKIDLLDAEIALEREKAR
jgi:hypothetical protein